MTGEVRTENGASVESGYIYDALGQLTAFTKSDGYSETYAYDAAGNMTAKTADGVKTQYKYNAGNQLTESVTGAETTKYSYDAVGNLVKKDGAGGSVSYTYNALNLLEQWTDGTHTETYAYNASGLLASVTTETSTTELIWDILNGDGQVLTATTDGETTAYTYGLERISAITGKARTEYVYDARGSVAAEITNSGTISKAYTPFGEQLGEATSGFGYNGEYYNAETGQVYLRARFYEPEMNRFSQKDIIRGSVTDGLSLNRYLYCENDPVNFVDSNGLRRTGSTAQSRTEAAKSYASANASRSNVSSAKTASSAFWSAAHDNAVNIAKTTQSKADSSAYYSAAKDTAAASGGYDYYYVPEVRQTSSGSSNYYTGSAYDANGNSTGFFNSSYDAGSVPSVDAPTIRDATEAEIAQCSTGAKNSNTFFTQKDLEEIVINTLGKNANVDFTSGKIDYTYIEAERNNARTLKEALQNAKDWPNSVNGKYTMSVLSLALVAVGGSIAASGAATIAIGGSMVSAGTASSTLIATGASSLLGGHVNEQSGGSYAAGWAGGGISGLATGYGLGAAGNILKSALLVEEAGVVATGSALLKSFAAAEAKTAVYGTAGGAAGSAITQKFDQGTVNVDSAVSAGIVNGTVAAFAAPYTIIPSGIGTGDTISTVVSLIVTAINEIVADSSSATLSY